MKFKLFIVIVSILLTSHLVKGQNHIDQLPFSSLPAQRDSLIIERQDGQKIRLIWPYQKNAKKEVAWEQLLDDFQTDFGKVADNVPDYKFYKIVYIQKQNLVIEEVKGKETYTVNEKDGMDYVDSNTCLLLGKKIQLSIEFSDYKELLDPSLKAEIEVAISQIKNKFFFSTLSPQRHYFDVNSKRMLPKPKSKYKFFVPMGAKLGLLKNQPYIELRPGLGLIKDKQSYFALNWNIMTQYNEVIQKTEFDSFVGLTIGSVGAGFGSEVAFKVKSNISDNEEIYYKAGINYRTKSGIQIGAEYYLGEPSNTDESLGLLFGFNVGFGF